MPLSEEDEAYRDYIRMRDDRNDELKRAKQHLIFTVLTRQNTYIAKTHVPFNDFGEVIITCSISKQDKHVHQEIAESCCYRQHRSSICSCLAKKHQIISADDSCCPI